MTLWEITIHQRLHGTEFLPLLNHGPYHENGILEDAIACAVDTMAAEDAVDPEGASDFQITAINRKKGTT